MSDMLPRRFSNIDRVTEATATDHITCFEDAE
jgi:hypothetical protein